MSDVLCGMEHTEGQASQEVSGRQEARNGAKGEASAVWRHRH